MSHDATYSKAHREMNQTDRYDARSGSIRVGSASWVTLSSRSARTGPTSREIASGPSISSQMGRSDGKHEVKRPIIPFPFLWLQLHNRFGKRVLKCFWLDCYIPACSHLILISPSYFARFTGMPPPYFNYLRIFINHNYINDVHVATSTFLNRTITLIIRR